jgi:hypothetical protein
MAPRPRAHYRGTTCVLDRLSAFLSEDIGSALKGDGKLCQRIINELPPLLTEYALNLDRTDLFGARQ